MQAAVGVDSYFELHKTLITKAVAYGPASRGKYSVSYGLPNHEQGITIIDPPIRLKGVLTIDNTTKSGSELFKKQMKEFEEMQELLATPEIYFKTDGNEKLIQTNRSFDAKGSKFVLYKRSSLFTVEGYITCEDSVTEFFERNTMKKWKVASLCAIDSVKIKYIELATEPSEGIYLKALAYSIADATSESNGLLVIKRLLRMEKSSLKNQTK